jgi:gamma-glutamylcyclotransferase (GGCT)/AIG2-like uncharacterized protein YtfP
MTRLFFYGTLMSSESRGHVLRGLAAPVGPATIPGALYSVGADYFPAYLPTDDVDSVVVGEVWEVFPGCEANAVATTDMIESYRPGDPLSMYVREDVEATFPDGSTADVETYRWNSGGRDLSRRIPGGDWRSYRDGDRLPMNAA